MDPAGTMATAAGGERPAFARAYVPPLAVYDEMLGADGRLRPAWDACLRRMSDWTDGDLARGLAETQRHLREAGVVYRVYDDPEHDRPWALNPLPVLIEASEFRTLEQAVVQRAELLEALLADLYGPARLVRDGVLPAAVVAGSPEFLRPLAGAVPAGGHHLHFCAFDLGRSPDGRWWMLGDRTQAPSGAGYALENRIALSRALPDLYRALDVERLAAFFQSFRAALVGHQREAGSRVGLLTPGRLNETYFEHAYLARYLGFVLVEGEDLTVRDGKVYLRTIGGLRRVETLWRRLDADYADPLELNGASRIGVPGLVQAARRGSVTIANAHGAGLAESRALMSFMPAVARALRGEELLLPNIATWWCGQPAERRHVIRHLDRLVVAPAHRPALPGLLGDGAAKGAELGPAERSRLVDAIERRGADFVGQELVPLSTTPVLQDGVLQPRPFVLRLFAARGESGWDVMPGGFCRVSDDLLARAVSLQRGGRSADLWVLGEGPVDQTTLLPPPATVPVRRAMGALPSRAADNLFWVGRYVERSEGALRVLRALVSRATEAAGPSAPALQALGDLLFWIGAIPPGVDRVDPIAVSLCALSDTGAPSAVPATARAALNAASNLRDRFSPDAWRTLSRLAAVHATRPEPNEAALIARVEEALLLHAAFSGLAQENMNRMAGWRFLELGRRVERGIVTCNIARFLSDPAAGPAGLDLVLELCDSAITYGLRYVMAASGPHVLDLVLLDPHNPRSLAFQADQLARLLDELPMQGDGRPAPFQETSARIALELKSARAETLGPSFATALAARLMQLSDEITEAYFASRDLAPPGWEGAT
jgi:uncharacterized circularly permuted ATP-grasp superfamily protein/uncharacterized alpha-E superfamily protein